MLIAILQFIGLAAVIVAAGSVLARTADQIAEATGLGRLLIGSVLLAGATSLPELTVDITAVREGMPDLAVGDLLGSSLMNLLILAALDLSHQSRGKMLSRIAAAHAMGGMLSITLTALVGLALITTKRVPDWSFAGIHVWLWLIAMGYAAGVRLVFLDQRIAAKEAREAQPPSESPQPLPPMWRLLLIFAGAAAVILVIGPYLATTAGRIADLSGLGKTFVGTTFVALSTSLPELVASIAALRMGAFDLCIGNIFGSNAFNMLLFFPLDWAYPGTLFDNVSAGHLVSAVSVVICSSFVIMGQLYQSETRRRFIEPDAWLVITAVIGSLMLVYHFP